MLKDINSFRLLAAIAASVFLSGCLFGNSVEVSGFVNEDSGTTSHISISTNSTWTSCSADNDDPNTFSCSYFTADNISNLTVSSLELLLLLFLVDPIVIELPDTVSVSAGSYVHTNGSGALQVSGPLTSVPIDFDRSFTPSAPNRRLWVVSVPEPFRSNNPTGNYGFNLQMTAPVNTSFDMAAVITGQVRDNNSTDYYPPLFPCIFDMASAPTVTIPINGGGIGGTTVDIPSGLSGCPSGTTLNYGSASAPSPIPMLPPLILAVLAIGIAGFAGWRLRS